MVLTAIHWRNTWKYRARAYRHFFWDAGTLLANLLATAAAGEVTARILLGFADPLVNALLGLDADAGGQPRRWCRSAAAPDRRRRARPRRLSLCPGCRCPRARSSYPLVRLGLRGLERSRTARPRAAGSRAGTGPDSDAGEREIGRRTGASRRSCASRALGETILRRGSTREFRRDPIAGARFAAILDAALRPLPLDLDSSGPALVETYLMVHAVEGLPAGAYVWDPDARTPRLLRAGEFRREGGELCLEQPLGADASAVAFFLADLDAVSARWGSRGYRAVNLAAGLLGGRLYLGAYGLGLGATGLTFYDDDVVRFFEPDAAGKDAIFVTALGPAARRRAPQRSGAGAGGARAAAARARPDASGRGRPSSLRELEVAHLEIGDDAELLEPARPGGSPRRHGTRTPWPRRRPSRSRRRSRSHLAGRPRRAGTERVDGRSGLERPHLVDADHRAEALPEAVLGDHGLEHARRAVRKDGARQVPQPAEDLAAPRGRHRARGRRPSGAVARRASARRPRRRQANARADSVTAQKSS